MVCFDDDGSEAVGTDDVVGTNLNLCKRTADRPCFLTFRHFDDGIRAGDDNTITSF